MAASPYVQPAVYLPVALLAAAVAWLALALIARRREHGRELAASAARFRALIESSSEALILLDRRGHIAYASPAASALTGYTTKELVSHTLFDCVHPDDVPALTHLLERAPGSPDHVETISYRVRRKDETWRRVESVFRNLLSDPNVGAIVVNCLDVTEKVQVLEELERAKARAETASNAKSDFLATMSHEIRTPMNGVSGMASLLLATSLNEEQREYAEAIRSSADALRGIVSDILDLTRIEAGKVTFEQEPFDLRETLGDVVDLMRPALIEKKLEGGYFYPSDVPGWFKGDAGRIRQIALNLMANAIKFTGRGMVSLSVEVGAEQGGVCPVTVTVRDTGIGIARDQLDRMFDRFTQAEPSTTRKYGGSGLGLAISKGFVERMGGSIWARSELGHGSSFSFRLPLRPSPDQRPPQAIKPQALPQDGATILVVEDNLLNCKVVTRMLEKLGARAEVAENGAAAMRMWPNRKYDLILMDCQMPEMDGYEATRRIRAAEGGSQHMPIVAMTANAMIEDRERCMQAGMDDFLAKPIDMGALAGVLQRWVTVKPKA